MDYINQVIIEHDGILRGLGALGTIFGGAGFIFGIWRYFKERKTQKQLEDRQRELDEAHSQLKHLKDLASNLKQYSTAV